MTPPPSPSRDITCLNRIQVILKSYEDASNSKINFSKSQASAQFPLKYLELTLVRLFPITSNRAKSVKVQQKNPYLELSETLFERQKDNCKPNPLIQTVVHWSALYNSKIYQKRIYDFLWNRKKCDLSDTFLNSPFGRLDQVFQTQRHN